MTFNSKEEDSEDSDIVLTKINDEGDIIWSKEFDSDYSDGGGNLVATTDDNFYLIINRGNEIIGSYGDILKINSYGDTLFTKRIVSNFSVVE